MKNNNLIQKILSERKKVDTKQLRICPDCGKNLYFDAYVGNFKHVTDFCCYAENEYGECVMNNDIREKLMSQLRT